MVNILVMKMMLLYTEIETGLMEGTLPRQMLY